MVRYQHIIFVALLNMLVPQVWSATAPTAYQVLKVKEALDQEEGLRNMAKDSGEWATALIHAKTAKGLKDSLIEIESLVHLAKNKEAYNLERKDKEIAERKKQLERKREEAAYDKRLVSIIVVVGIVLILVTSVTLVLIRKNRANRENIRAQRREVEKLEILSTMDRLKLQALSYQMNQSFINNSVEKVRRFLDEREIKEAYGYLNAFSSCLRHMMLMGPKEFINLRDEIEFIRGLLKLESSRLDQSVRYELHVVNEEYLNNEMQIPPTLIQPFVEQGLSMLDAEKGKIHVEFGLNKEELICTIQYPGSGVSRTEHDDSLGIVKERLALIGQRYEVKHSESEGLRTIEMYIPVNARAIA